MYLFLALLFVWLGIGPFMYAYNKFSKVKAFDGEDWAMFQVFGCLFGGLLFLFLGVGLIPMAYGSAPYHQDPVIRLLSIEDQDIKAHKPTIYSGYVDGQFRYFYFQKTKSGAINQTYVDGEETDVFYEPDRSAAELLTFRSKGHFEEWGYQYAQTDKYELHLPKGTEIRQYQAGGG